VFSITKYLFEKPPSIILSLDVSLEKAIIILEDLKDLKQEIAGLKIGSILCWRYGLPSVVKKIREICDFPVIFDAQKAGTDIPYVVEKQVEVVAESKVDAFIAAPHGAGPATLAAFVSACTKYKIIPIIVLEMTHPRSDAFLAKDAPNKILEKSLVLGATNFVAPANKPEKLKIYRNVAEKKRIEIKIFSPGVGSQGGSPDSAVEAGADFTIVGRLIYRAVYPKKKVKLLYNLIKKAYSIRKKGI